MSVASITIICVRRAIFRLAIDWASRHDPPTRIADDQAGKYVCASFLRTALDIHSELALDALKQVLAYDGGAILRISTV